METHIYVIHSAGNAAVAQQYNTNEREYMINWSKQDVKLLLMRVYMYILRVVVVISGDAYFILHGESVENL